MVQEYLNEIPPTIYGPNKPKTLGKPLRIADLQPPASGQDKPDTLYFEPIKYEKSRKISPVLQRVLGNRETAEGEPRPGRRHGALPSEGGLGGRGRGAAVERPGGPRADVT